MSFQREKPGTNLAELNVTLGRAADAPGFCGGGQIENFKEGWALNIMGGQKAHYFTRVRFNSPTSTCGLLSSVRWLYGEGNFPRCKRCERLLAMVKTD